MKSIIRKWYKELHFPEKYDGEFSALLDSFCENESDPPNCGRDLITDKLTPQQKLLYALYLCEATAEKYKTLGIPEKTLYDTLADVVIWTNTYYSMFGKLGLVQTDWLYRHIDATIFKLGRLQFALATIKEPMKNHLGEVVIPEGEVIVEIHIPEGEPLLESECRRSLENADKFFAQYFPECKWSYYTCHSWLLDEVLKSFVGPDSNIARFMGLFNIINKEPEDSALRYVFRRDANRENLDTFEAKSTLAKKIKEYVMAGGELHAGIGYIKR